MFDRVIPASSLIVPLAASAIALLGLARARRRRWTRRKLIRGPCTFEIRKGHASDDILFKNYVPVGVFLKGRVNEEALHYAIHRFLEAVPPAAGRLRKIHGRWEVEANGEGALFEVLERRCEYSLKQVSTLALRNKEALSYITSVCQLPSKLPEPFEMAPLLRVQLAVFNDGEFSVVTIGPAHVLFDGASMVALLHFLSYHTGLALDKEICVPAMPPTMTFERIWTSRTQNKVTEINVRHHPAWDVKDDASSAKLTQFQALYAQKAPGMCVVQLVLDARSVERLRNLCPAEISIHEVLSALIIRGSVGDSEPDEQLALLLTVTNLRGRTEMFPNKGFFGNAAESTPSRIKVVKGEPWIDLAQRIHETLRRDIREKCEDIFLYNEALRDFKGHDRFQAEFVPLNGVALLNHGKSFIINSWRGYPWYDVDFGTGNVATRVGAPAFTAFFAPRYCQIEQCSPQGDVRLLLTLRTEEARSIYGYLCDVRVNFDMFQGL